MARREQVPDAIRIPPAADYYLNYAIASYKAPYRSSESCNKKLFEKALDAMKGMWKNHQESPSANASAATVADRAPAQFAVRTFIVRLMSQGSEIRNREIHT